MPSFGLLTNPSIEITKEIRTIHKLGFDFIEIGIEAPEGAPEILEKKRGKIVKLLKNFKGSPIGHTSHWIDLGSTYESVRNGWVVEAQRSLRTAEKLGITLVNFHANTNGLFFGKNRKIILKNWVESLQEIIAYAKNKNIEIMLENMPKGRSVHTVDEFKYITRHVPELKVHLDVPHAFTSGGIECVLDYIRTFTDRIAHIHWHDNHGEHDEHLPIGDGLINHKRVVNALKEIDYERTITLEVFTSMEEAKASTEKLKELWTKV